jgi:hypothetical protein
MSSENFSTGKPDWDPDDAIVFIHPPAVRLDAYLKQRSES